MWRPRPSRAQRPWRPFVPHRLPRRTRSAATSTKLVSPGRSLASQLALLRPIELLVSASRTQSTEVVPVPANPALGPADISQAVAKSSAKAEANTATNTKRISVLARRHAGASGLGMLPSWAPPLPLNRRHVARGQADDAGPTGKEAGEAAVAQREEGMSLPASLARHTANAMREEMQQSGDAASVKRPGALPQADRQSGAALAAAMPSLPAQSVQPIIRWASMAAVGASVNPAWGPPPDMDVAQHAKRARPADFGEEPGTTAVAVGGGLRRERQPTDPLSGSTGTVPGVDDGSSRVASLSDGHLRIMPPNPAESGVPRSNEIRSAGFPGSGPSAPLRRIAEEASKEELLSGTFMPDPSGVAGAE